MDRHPCQRGIENNPCSNRATMLIQVGEDVQKLRRDSGAINDGMFILACDDCAATYTEYWHHVLDQTDRLSPRGEG